MARNEPGKTPAGDIKKAAARAPLVIPPYFKAALKKKSRGWKYE
jgi:hypothetical protein